MMHATADRPKPMVRVNGRRFIDKTLGCAGCCRNIRNYYNWRVSVWKVERIAREVHKKDLS